MKIINKSPINLTAEDRAAIAKDIAIRNGFIPFTMHDMVIQLSSGTVRILAQTKSQGGQSWTIRQIKWAI
jgi:hypothetical protein